MPPTTSFPFPSQHPLTVSRFIQILPIRPFYIHLRPRQARVRQASQYVHSQAHLEWFLETDRMSPCRLRKASHFRPIRRQNESLVHHIGLVPRTNFRGPSSPRSRSRSLTKKTRGEIVRTRTSRISQTQRVDTNRFSKDPPRLWPLLASLRASGQQ